MTNKNALTGLKCPRCDSEEPLQIAVKVWALIFDNGVTEYQEPEWTGSSPCVCHKCRFTGTVKDFEPKRKTSGNPNGNRKNR